MDLECGHCCHFICAQGLIDLAWSKAPGGCLLKRDSQILCPGNRSQLDAEGKPRYSQYGERQMDLCRGPVGTTGNIEFKAQRSNESVVCPLSHSPTQRKAAPDLTKEGGSKGKRKLEMSPAGWDVALLTSPSVSVRSQDASPSAAGDNADEELASKMIVEPEPTVTSIGKDLVVKVLGLHAEGGPNAGDEGGGSAVYGNADAAGGKAQFVTASGTQETIDGLDPRTEDAGQPHLNSRATSATSLLTVISRARDLVHALQMEAADIAQLAAQLAVSQPGIIPSDGELLMVLSQMLSDAKAVKLHHEGKTRVSPDQPRAIPDTGRGKQGVSATAVQGKGWVFGNQLEYPPLPKKALLVTGPRIGSARVLVTDCA